MAPPGHGRGKKEGGSRGGGKAGRGRGKAIEVKPVVVLDLPPVIEDVWAQCDTCQKWRRLPPGTELPGGDDAPWFCNLNPDKEKASCSIPEDSYDEQKEVVICSSDPFYGAGAERKDMEVVKKELQAKVGYIEPPPPSYSPALPAKQKKSFFDSGGYGGQYVKQGAKQGVKQRKEGDKVISRLEEQRNLSAACTTLVANAGSWEAAGPQGKVTAVPPPSWVWQGMAKYVPDVVQEAVFAFDALSAVKCMASQQAAGALSLIKKEEPQLDSTAMDASGPGVAASGASTAAAQDPVSQLQQLAQLALLTAASIALPKVKDEVQRLQGTGAETGPSNQYVRQPLLAQQPSLGIGFSPMAGLGSPGLNGSLAGAVSGGLSRGLSQGMDSSGTVGRRSSQGWPQQGDGAMVNTPAPGVAAAGGLGSWQQGSNSVPFARRNSGSDSGAGHLNAMQPGSAQARQSLPGATPNLLQQQLSQQPAVPAGAAAQPQQQSQQQQQQQQALIAQVMQNPLAAQALLQQLQQAGVHFQLPLQLGQQQRMAQQPSPQQPNSQQPGQQPAYQQPVQPGQQPAYQQAIQPAQLAANQQPGQVLSPGYRQSPQPGQHPAYQPQTQPGQQPTYQQYAQQGQQAGYQQPGQLPGQQQRPQPGQQASQQAGYQQQAPPGYQQHGYQQQQQPPGYHQAGYQQQTQSGQQAGYQQQQQQPGQYAGYQQQQQPGQQAAYQSQAQPGQQAGYPQQQQAGYQQQQPGYQQQPQSGQQAGYQPQLQPGYQRTAHQQQAQPGQQAGYHMQGHPPQLGSYQQLGQPMQQPNSQQGGQPPPFGTQPPPNGTQPMQQPQPGQPNQWR